MILNIKKNNAVISAPKTGFGIGIHNKHTATDSNAASSTY